jgi:N-acetylneuraminate synthase
VSRVYTQEYLDSPRESPWGNTQRDQKEGLEFDLYEYKEIDHYCRKVGIPWFASAWDIISLRFLRQFDLPYNKIASAMIVDHELLKAVAAEQKHTFISTGMCNMDMIAPAVDIFNEANCPFELMHCVGTYPMDYADANLTCMRTLSDYFGGCGVGWSGHEDGIAVSCAAAALGAVAIERHITLDRSTYGSDQAASLGPDGLRHLVGAVRKIEQCMGDGAKTILEKEIPIAAKLRAHIEIDFKRIIP